MTRIVDINDLQAKAAAAHRWPWKMYSYGGDEPPEVGYQTVKHWTMSCGGVHEDRAGNEHLFLSDMEFIVACTPEVVLALIERIRLSQFLLTEEGMWTEEHPIDLDDPDRTVEDDDE